MKRASILLASLLSIWAFSGCLEEQPAPSPNGGENTQGGENNTVNPDEGTKIPNGSACSANSDCESGNCFLGKICRTENWRNPVGKECVENNHCESNLCDGGVCKSNGNDKTPNGSECTANSECESGNCFLNKVCRAQNWRNPVGKECVENSHCESNLCDNGICQSNGNGGNNGSAGVTCDKNAFCASNVCLNNVCLDTEDAKIVDSNVTTLGSKKDGESCTASTECESGLCHEGQCNAGCATLGCDIAYTVCRHNKCIPANTVGDECQSAGDCNIGEYCCSGFCKVGTCEAGIACGDTEAGRRTSECSNDCSSTSWGDYCGCWVDSECGNGYYCDFYDTELCLPKKNVNDKCSYDKECLSGDCSYAGVCVIK